jgi:hypothetical protein
MVMGCGGLGQGMFIEHEWFYVSCGFDGVCAEDVDRIMELAFL